MIYYLNFQIWTLPLISAGINKLVHSNFLPYVTWFEPWWSATNELCYVLDFFCTVLNCFYLLVHDVPKFFSSLILALKTNLNILD